MNDRFLVIHDVCILSLCLSLSFENYMAGWNLKLCHPGNGNNFGVLHFKKKTEDIDERITFLAIVSHINLFYFLILGDSAGLTVKFYP